MSMSKTLPVGGAAGKPERPEAAGKTPSGIGRSGAISRRQASAHIQLVGLVLELGARVERLEAALRTRPVEDNGGLFEEADRIVERVARMFTISVATLRSDWRERHVVEARWLAAELLAQANFSPSATMRALGWSATGSVDYARKRHKDCLETLPHYRLAWEKLNTAGTTEGHE